VSLWIAVMSIVRGAAPTRSVQAKVNAQLDTPPLGSSHGVLGAANFGTITSAGDPRVVQLTVKWRF